MDDKNSFSNSNFDEDVMLEDLATAPKNSIASPSLGYKDISLNERPILTQRELKEEF